MQENNTTVRHPALKAQDEIWAAREQNNQMAQQLQGMGAENQALKGQIAQRAAQDEADLRAYEAQQQAAYNAQVGQGQAVLGQAQDPSMMPQPPAEAQVAQGAESPEEAIMGALQNGWTPDELMAEGVEPEMIENVLMMAQEGQGLGMGPQDGQGPR